MNIIEFANVLANAGCHPHKSHNGYQARCPAHEDNKPSLSVSSTREGNALVCCRAGCSLPDILSALGLTLDDLAAQTQPWEAGTEPSSYAKSSSLADVTPEKVSWLWHAHIPLGKLTVLDGDPGLGKSTITVDIAARLSTAQEMPDGSRGDLDAPSSTILITAEDGLGDTVQPRALAAGADLNYIHAITGVVTSEGSTDWQMPDHLNELEALVNEKTAKLIIIDPLMAMLSANVNTYRDQDIRRVLRGLAELADRSGAAVVVVRHLTKSSGANGLYRGSGSIGIIGAARSGLLVAHNPDDEDTCIMASTKSNLAEMPPAIAYRLVPHNDTSKVEWLGTTDHKVADILQVTDPEERSALEDAEEWLSGILAFEPVPATTIFKAAAAVGYSEKTIRRAKSKLGVVAKQEGRQWIWSLPTTTESDKSDGQGISDGQTA